MDERYPYQKHWKEYKGRRYIKFFFWIVYCILLAVLYFSDLTVSKKGIFAFVLILGFFAIELYVANFYCPRCGHKFFKKRKWFAYKNWNKCNECGLKLYEGSTYKWTMIG
jgi:predicted RNA-binding Zn-ribbon protein involved in translation (DUF1610 family)